MKRILVTGGAGFVGSHVTAGLADKGYQVAVFDALRDRPTSLFTEMQQRGIVEFIEGDLTNRDAIRSVLGSHPSQKSFDCVIHCAANSDTRRASYDDSSDFTDGVLATRVLLDEMSRTNTKSLLAFSSQHVYGSNPNCQEGQELCPISSYGASKAMMEMLLRYYASTKGFKIGILRCSNIVGRGQKFGILPDFIRKLHSFEESIEILGDGTQLRSFVHTEDVIQAVLLLLDVVLASESDFDVFNVASEDAISISQVISLVSSMSEGVATKALHFNEGERGWPGDLGTIQIPITKLQTIGWRPRYSSREAIMRAAQEIMGTI